MPKNLLIKNAHTIVTMDKESRVFHNSHLLIKDNIISKIGNFDISKEKPDKVVDASNMVILPGFINTHHHFYQVLTRCLKSAQNVGLTKWLKANYPIWQKLNPEGLRKASKIAIAELLLSGCTTTVDDLYIFPNGDTSLCDAEIDTAREMGIRFHFCRGSMDRGESQGGLPPDNLVQKTSDIIKDLTRIIKKYHNPTKYSMQQVMVGCSSVFSVSSELLMETRKIAKEYDVRRHIHLTQNRDEINRCKTLHGITPFAFLFNHGWLEDDVILVHGIGLNKNEIEKIASSGAGISYCATSNMRIGQGIAPIVKLRKFGVPVGIGVDGSASNDSSNMLHEIRMAMMLQRVKYGASSITAMDVLKMATVEGAKLLGRNDIGSLEVGKAADIIGINLKKLEYTGALQEPAAIVFCASHYVDFVHINDKIIVKDGKLLTGAKIFLNRSLSNEIKV